MSRAKTSLQIDGIEYAIGDKVLVNPETSSGSQERIETVLRKIDIDEYCILLWFSKNNFACETTDKDYDVITHFLWKEGLSSYIDNLNIEHIKELKKDQKMRSLKIKVGGRVIEFKKTNAVFCKVKDGWDFDFKELKDGWIHELESESNYFYYLRMVNDSKSVKVLYVQAMYREDGELQTFSLDPVVVWVFNEDCSQGTIFQDSYLFQNVND